MRRTATLVTAGAAIVLVVAQFVLPRLISGRVEDRLTERGGSADVDLAALPAVRLLLTEGDSVRVRAQGVSLPVLAPGRKSLEALDGFGEVDVRVSDARVGPFRLESFSLVRSGSDHSYRTAIRGTVTARDLGTFTASQLGGTFGGFLGGMLGGAVPFGDRPVPLDLTAVLRSEGGRPRAVTVDGTVAGVPAAPLAEVLAQALAGRF